MKEQKKENRIGLIFPKIYSISQEKRRDRQRLKQRQIQIKKEMEREVRGGQGSSKRKSSKRVQDVRLVATFEDIYPKVRQGQMPKY